MRNSPWPAAPPIELLLAIEAGAVNCAGRAAATALTHDPDSDRAVFEIAAAKLRANMAVGIGAAIAHQVHGAIGVTDEYALHYVTLRALAWREEFGNEVYWSTQLGRAMQHAGADAFWPTLSAA